MLGVLVGSAGLGACTVEEPAPPERCVPVSFESAEVVYGPEPVLLVSATLPPPSLTLELNPVQYVQQPEHWELNVVACGPARDARPDEAPITATGIPFPIGDTLGTEGVAVVGAGGQRQLIDVRWDPPPPAPTTTAPPDADLYDHGRRPVVNYAAVPGGPLVSQRSGIAVDFKAGGTVEVTGCHVSVGRWTADGAALSVADLALGERRENPVAGGEVCAGPAAEAEEVLVLDALRRAASYKVVPAQQLHTWYLVPVRHLVLSDAEGRIVLTGGVYTR